METAVVLPVFLVCMLAVLQLLNVYGTAVRLQSAMTQTAGEMAVGAYASQYDGGSEPLMRTALNVGYAGARTRQQAGDLSALKNVSFLLSTMPETNGRVTLVCTYRMRSPVGMVRMPWSIFVQKASVRAWTGRSGSDGLEHTGEGEDTVPVYVAENGTVYHRDPDCTHIRLSISQVTMSQAEASRNRYGARYHACEHCGSKAGGMVYITTDGNRYHSSLSCSGLKRTITETTLKETGSMRACSKCGS